METLAMLVLALTVAGAPQNHEYESALMEAHPTMLVEKIRRQLMTDNYDYMPPSSSEEFPPRARDHTPAPAPAPRLDSAINEHFIVRANDASADADRRNSHAVDMKDLLYYVDDTALTASANARRASRDDTETGAEAAQTNTNVTEVASRPPPRYKILKMKQSAGRRRLGSGLYRRFIEEETPEGVALMALDELPLPQFRLPPARRQYMTNAHHDQQGHSSSREAHDLLLTN